MKMPASQLSILIAVIVLLYDVGEIDGACGFQPTQVEVTVYGTQVKFCEYKGIKLLVGSIIFDRDECERITCTEDSLFICGHGYKAGAITPPTGCIAVPDGCDSRFITNVCTPPIVIPQK